MINLVLGNGQIGSSVTNVIAASGKVYVFDKTGGEPPIIQGVDLMHICFPCWDVEEFVKIVETYERKYRPKFTVIWSTVPIGTTKRIENAIHSPIEGRHPKLEESIRLMPRWFGYNTPEAGDYFVDYFDSLDLEIKGIESSDWTEALKLLSTTEYGVNLLFADYKAKVAKAIGMDFARTKEWNTDYNELYENLNQDNRFQKFVLDAPDGKIGGHCVVPNAKLLNDQFPDTLVKLIEEMG